jgi:ABC-type Fe3+/spermidine/putrescine transport system ATPase subunit
MIESKDLQFQFDKRGIAGLHGVTLSVNEGEIFGVMGPNGSGKTTLLKLLSGGLPPQAGTSQVSGKIALFPSIETMVTSNVQKYLINSVTLDIDEDKKIQLARDLADTFEFTFQLRQNLNELSSGQRQKVLLSKELINKPSILFLDEPFTHLDPFTRKDILSSLFEYIRHQNITVIWITHDLSEAFKFSDRIGVLNFGKFEQIASPIDLVKSPKNLFVAQFVGYRNFFPVKKSNNSWVSHWGEVPWEFEGNEDALLIVPDDAWNFSKNGVEMKINKISADKQKIEYQLILNDQKVFLNQGPKSKQLKLGESIKLSPNLLECFLISL